MIHIKMNDRVLRAVRAAELLNVAAIARFSSIKETARALGKDSASMTRDLARVEELFGCRIFDRTVGRSTISITKDGAIVLDRIEQAMAILNGSSDRPNSALHMMLDQAEQRLEEANQKLKQIAKMAGDA